MYFQERQKKHSINFILADNSNANTTHSTRKLNRILAISHLLDQIVQIRVDFGNTIKHKKNIRKKEIREKMCFSCFGGSSSSAKVAQLSVVMNHGRKISMAIEDRIDKRSVGNSDMVDDSLWLQNENKKNKKELSDDEDSMVIMAGNNVKTKDTPGSFNSNEEENECIICFHPLDSQQLTQLPCDHRFHEQCINDWIAEDPTCPLCRDPLTCEGLKEKAWEYFKQQHYKLSENYCQRCLTLDPKDTDVHERLAYLLKRRGEIDKAEYHYKKCLGMIFCFFNFHAIFSVFQTKKNRVQCCVIPMHDYRVTF